MIKTTCAGSLLDVQGSELEGLSVASSPFTQFDVLQAASHEP